MIRPFLRLPVVPVPNIPLQPMEVGVVASELADLVDAGPSGRAPDLGGPEVQHLPDLVRSWCAAEGLRRRVVALPWVGAIASGALVYRGPQDGADLGGLAGDLVAWPAGRCCGEADRRTVAPSQALGPRHNQHRPANLLG